MSELNNRKRLDPNATPLKKFVLALLCYPFGFMPGLVLLYMSLRVHPVKWKWFIFSLMGIAASVVFCTVSIMLNNDVYIPLNMLVGILLVIYVFKTRAYEEYVMRYNALVDSGYFVEKERIKAANLQRWEDETALKAREQAEALTYQPKGVAVPRPRTAAIDADTLHPEALPEIIDLDEPDDAESTPAADDTESPADDSTPSHPSKTGRKLDL